MASVAGSPSCRYSSVGHVSTGSDDLKVFEVTNVQSDSMPIISSIEIWIFYAYSKIGAVDYFICLSVCP